MACGRQAEVVPELRRLVADQPMQEKLWALLIRALYGAGRQAEALEVYEAARTKIAEELGVDPGAELRQLYQQILNADGEAAAIPLAQPGAGRTPAPRHLPPQQLPADISDFTGRAGQVDRLRGLLAVSDTEDNPGAVRVALVVGAGGLGKTALAVHTAHLVASEFPDGQLYASLHGAAQPTDPSEVLARFLRALGAEPGQIPLEEEERAAQYRTRLAGKRVLIVLDDAQRRGSGPAAAAGQRLVRGAGHRPPQAARAGRYQGPRPRCAAAGGGPHAVRPGGRAGTSGGRARRHR